MIITDVRQPEAITGAQVTKVANSSADTKPAAEETPQMPKKVSIVLIKMLIFSSKHTLEKKRLSSLDCHPGMLNDCLATMQFIFHPLEGINVP